MPQPKRVSAFNRALQEAQQAEPTTAETRPEVKTVSQQNSITIPQQDSKAAKKQEKVMLYLTTDQLNKLEISPMSTESALASARTLTILCAISSTKAPATHSQT
jgi:hypothetical protein